MSIDHTNPQDKKSSRTPMQGEISEIEADLETVIPLSKGEKLVLSPGKTPPKVSDFDEIFAENDPIYNEIYSKLDENQRKTIINCVNSGIFTRQTLRKTIKSIIIGWKSCPGTIDGRIQKMITMKTSAAHGGRMAKVYDVEKHDMEKRNPDVDIDDLETGKTKPISQRPIKRIEDAEAMPGFIEAFTTRLGKVKKEHSLDIIDETVLRLLVSNEIHLDNIMAKQCRQFSAKRLIQQDQLLQQIKMCQETLKLSRKQRRIQEDDTGEKEAKERYEEFRGGSKKETPREELDQADAAKNLIKSVMSGNDDQDDEDVDEGDDGVDVDTSDSGSEFEE